MFTYIAAVATAASLLISPMIASTVEKLHDIQKTKKVSEIKVAVQSRIFLLDVPAVYHMSRNEQSAMRSALLRSVKVLHKQLPT